MAFRLSSSSALVRYGVAIGAVVLATLLRWPLVWTCGELPPFLLFFLAIALVALATGGGPAALATALSVVAALSLIPPSGRLQLNRSADLVAASFFLVSGSVIALMAAWLARSRRDLAAAAERHGAERERELATEFLRLVNESTGTRQLVQAALHFFKTHSGCAAVGIRLREGDDYPYHEARGFPEQFVRLENSLCVRNPDGEVQRDQAGNPVLACMCGSVISGRFDSSKPFFTACGSFWTNDTARLLTIAADADCPPHARNRCTAMGHKSVALIPLRVGEQRLGLLQLNDRHRNRFTPEVVALWERLAGYLAVALARAKADEAVRESEARFAKAFAANPDAMVLSRADDGLIREINDSCVRIFGYARDEVIGKRSIDLGVMDPADRESSMALLKKDGRLQDYELPIRRRSGEIRSTLCSVEPIEIAGEPYVLAIIRDVTEQKQAALDQDTATEVLRILNRGANDLPGLIGEVFCLIRERSGFDAVGLRLRQGDDCPYYQQDGFSDGFLREENFLCAKGADGSILRDPSGKAVLECTCGLVLSGRTDPTMPCFTEGGSFWTNRSTELLALAPEDDPREKPRNRCIHTGYQSVALVPVRSGEQIIGLLQLNDRRPDQFTPERIRFFESLAANLGMALQRHQTQEALRTSEQQYRAFFNTSAIGTAEVSPDGRILAVNDRYCQITGYSREELLALHPLQLSHPDDREHDAQGCMRHLRGELPAYDAEKRYVRKDGRIIWVRLTAAMSNDASGKPLRSFGIVQEITDRKCAEEALRQSEQRLIMAKEAANLGIFDCDIASDTMQWDSRLREFWGLAPDERVTLELFMAGVHPDDRALVQAAADKAMDPAGNGRFIAEHRVVRKDGRECWHAAMGQVSFEHGKAVRMVGTVQDITPRKHAEQALRESEQRLNRAQAIAHLGSWELDLTRNRLSWSDEVYRIFGLEPQEFGATYEAFIEHVHPDDRTAVDAAYSGSLRENRDSYEIEHRVLRKSGEIRFVHEKCQHVRDQAGRLVASLGMVLDITERKRAEEALRSVSAELQRTMDTAATGLIHCSRDLRYLSVNPAYARWVGLPPDQIIGRTLVDVLGHEAFEVIRPCIERVRRGEQVEYEADLPLATAIKPVHVVYTPDRDRYGNVLGWVASVTDISEQRRSAQELLAAKARAEQAQRAAESASQAKDHFLAVLSHELRTPLAPVVATVAMLRQDTRFDADTREALEMIHRNAELEARLIDDLLDVTRIVRGKIELDRRPIELSTIIRRAAEVCMPDIEARSLHFGIDATDAPCMVEADASRLQQVFWNLIKNAVKFTPEGGRVDVRCWRDGNGQVMAEVKDTGIGIEPEVMPRLFNAFEQGERSTTRQFGGLGLGLTISKAMVEMHGGSIQAHSEGKGKGATFTVRLPLMHAEAAVATPGPGQDTPQRTSPQPTRPLRILLVEDHGDTARIMKRLLNSQGHQVQTAGDVATAMQLAGTQQFDLLLSDLGLPDGSGVDLIRELRSRGATLPGIALSGYGQEEDIHRSREAGFSAHLTKPTNPDQLIETITRITHPNSTR